MAEKAAPAVVKQVLFSALDALYDYLSDIVIVGGWVPQIYAWKEEAPEIPVRSYDVDAAVARKLPVRGKKGIADVMEEAGFKKEVRTRALASLPSGPRSSRSRSSTIARARWNPDRVHNADLRQGRRNLHPDPRRTGRSGIEIH